MSFTSGKTGGEYAHKLNQSEIPNYHIGDIVTPVPYNHYNWSNEGIVATFCGESSSSKPGVISTNDMIRTSGKQSGWQINTNGGDKPHNNLQPYITVVFWRRVI